MTATFELPAGLEATAPPAARDGVRLLVARPGGIEHARFTDLGTFLAPGDLLVVNTSGTLAAAIDGTRHDGRAVTVHFATELDDGSWVVEVRPARGATGPVRDSRLGDVITLADDVRVTLAGPHPGGQIRLWRASVGVEGGVVAYLQRRGRPVRYAYVPVSFPLADYQTVFAREPGSAEMPSAGRPFTTELVTDLVTRGIGVAPITLHTGVSSQDPGEPPQPERYAVPEATRPGREPDPRRGRPGRRGGHDRDARPGDRGRRPGRRPRPRRLDRPRARPGRPARAVSGLVTGWHAPGASHLDLLAAVAGAGLVDRAYQEAVRARYLWHEFGDSCLLLP